MAFQPWEHRHFPPYFLAGAGAGGDNRNISGN